MVNGIVLFLAPQIHGTFSKRTKPILFMEDASRFVPLVAGFIYTESSRTIAPTVNKAVNTDATRSVNGRLDDKDR